MTKQQAQQVGILVGFGASLNASVMTHDEIEESEVGGSNKVTVMMPCKKVWLACNERKFDSRLQILIHKCPQIFIVDLQKVGSDAWSCHRFLIISKT